MTEQDIFLAMFTPDAVARLKRLVEKEAAAEAAFLRHAREGQNYDDVIERSRRNAAELAALSAALGSAEAHPLRIKIRSGAPIVPITQIRQTLAPRLSEVIS